MKFFYSNQLISRNYIKIIIQSKCSNLFKDAKIQKLVKELFEKESVSFSVSALLKASRTPQRSRSSRIFYSIDTEVRTSVCKHRGVSIYGGRQRRCGRVKHGGNTSDEIRGTRVPWERRDNSIRIRGHSNTITSV